MNSVILKFNRKEKELYNREYKERYEPLMEKNAKLIPVIQELCKIRINLNEINHMIDKAKDEGRNVEFAQKEDESIVPHPFRVRQSKLRSELSRYLGFLLKFETGDDNNINPFIEDEE